MKSFDYVHQDFPDHFTSEHNLTEQDIIDREYPKQFQDRNSENDKASVNWIKEEIGKLEVTEHTILSGIVIRTR